MNINDITITSLETITALDMIGKYLFTLDELQNATIANTQETTDITGKQGRLLNTLKRNKAVTVSGNNGMLSGGALATQLGADIEDGTFKIRYTDTIVVNSNKGVTTETAVGTTGNEIGTIYVRDTNNAYISGGRKLTQTSSEPSTGEFSYTPGTKEIKFFAGDIAAGTEVIAFYDAEVTGKKISNDADKYSKTLAVYIDVTCQDACDNLFHGQFIIDRADFSGTFTLQGGSDPSTQGFEFTSLPNLCTGKTDLWDFIVFD